MGVDSHWLGPPGTTKRKLPSIEVVASAGQNGTKGEHRDWVLPQLLLPIGTFVTTPF
jgi:hypothetical protein